MTQTRVDRYKNKASVALNRDRTKIINFILAEMSLLSPPTFSPLPHSYYCLVSTIYYLVQECLELIIETPKDIRDAWVFDIYAKFSSTKQNQANDVFYGWLTTSPCAEKYMNYAIAESFDDYKNALSSFNSMSKEDNEQPELTFLPILRFAYAEYCLDILKATLKYLKIDS